MSKEYKFRGKNYIVSPERPDGGCYGCAFEAFSAAECKSVEKHVGFDCAKQKSIFIEKPQSIVGFCPESTWGINPTKETLETVMAKGERIANSIMGFNSTELSFAHDKELNARETFLKIAKEHREYRRRLELNESRRFIVSLLENGILQPSATPKIHNTIESAEMEAERLCKLHHQEFAVLQVVSAVKPQEPKKEVFA